MRVDLEFHQLELRYERLRVVHPEAERRLLASLAEIGQQAPILVVARADTDERGLSTLEKTAVGAGAGAVVGAVTGAGVVEGAVIGAGGGLAWGLLDGERGREIKDDTALRFSLEDDLELD